MECHLTTHGIVVRVGKMELDFPDGTTFSGRVKIDGREIKGVSKVSLIADATENVEKNPLPGAGLVRVSLVMTGNIKMGEEEQKGEELPIMGMIHPE